MTNEIGRPRYTLSDLPENWKTIVRTIYADGGCDVEVRCALAIGDAWAMSNDLWDRFMKEEPDFSETVREGRQLSEMWWAKAGQKGINMGKDFNATTYIFSMKNRFKHWKDKQEVEHSGDSDAPPVFRLKIDNK